MKGYWGAIGLVVAGVVSIMASSDGYSSYKSESEYVAWCTGRISELVPRAEAASACKCVYRNAFPVVEARGDTEITDQEAEMFYDTCLSPIYAKIDAEAAWNAEARYGSTYDDDGGWGDESGSGSDWGN